MNILDKLGIKEKPKKITCKYCNFKIQEATKNQMLNRLKFHLNMNKKCKEIRETQHLKSKES